ncbi:uncharacterized protein LOC142750949 [Rhinoderma darwinii]|uniref:uncharacterized protein LOC142750949 n=1 Tax=Rhinoderma darwinii TaxID=43563 RepID=UPI003F67AEC7
MKSPADDSDIIYVYHTCIMADHFMDNSDLILTLGEICAPVIAIINTNEDNTLGDISPTHLDNENMGIPDIQPRPFIFSPPIFKGPFPQPDDIEPTSTTETRRKTIEEASEKPHDQSTTSGYETINLDKTEPLPSFNGQNKSERSMTEQNTFCFDEKHDSITSSETASSKCDRQLTKSIMRIKQSTDSKISAVTVTNPDYKKRQYNKRKLEFTNPSSHLEPKIKRQKQESYCEEQAITPKPKRVEHDGHSRQHLKGEENTPRASIKHKRLHKDNNQEHARVQRICLPDETLDIPQWQEELLNGIFYFFLFHFSIFVLSFF